MEWGNFWSSHLPHTPVDEALDNETMNPGEQVVTYIFLGMVVATWFVRYRELKYVVVYLAGF
jgi:hexokinase